MTQQHIYELDLDLIKEPDELWNKLFLTWLKNITETNAMNIRRIGALDQAVTQLDRAVTEMVQEKPDDLRAAMDALNDVQEEWRQQSSRSVDNVERLAVLMKHLIASQKDK